jgi:hypothetical protein
VTRAEPSGRNARPHGTGKPVAMVSIAGVALAGAETEVGEPTVAVAADGEVPPGGDADVVGN